MPNVTFKLESGLWAANPYTVQPDEVAVSFKNNSDAECEVHFGNPNTFGSAYVGIAPHGTLSINILKRESTVFGADPMEKAPGETLDMGPGQS